MKPLDVGPPRVLATEAKSVLVLSSALPVDGRRFTRRRIPLPSASRFQPWILLLTTTAAAVFCYLYITKPVIQPLASAPAAPTAAKTTPTTTAKATPPATDQAIPSPVAATNNLLPDSHRLPGDNATAQAKPATPASSRQALPSGGNSSPMEETNLRMQHILTATLPDGPPLSRIVLDVPVLYKSRNLAWTPAQVAESRQLLERLTTYQEQTRTLRDEGQRLLADWNRLVAASIPGATLRADSPSLPENQNRSSAPVAPVNVVTQLQSAGK